MQPTPDELGQLTDLGRDGPIQGVRIQPRLRELGQLTDLRRYGTRQGVLMQF